MLQIERKLPKRVFELTTVASIDTKKMKSIEDDNSYNKIVHEGDHLTDDERWERNQRIAQHEWQKKLNQLDSALNTIKDSELCDYIIICSTKLFGKPEPAELALIREYKRKFGNVKTIRQHLHMEEN